MKPVEISLSLAERRRIKRMTRRIYNRLIIESPQFNRSADQLQNIVLGLFTLAIIGGAAWAAGQLAARSARWLENAGFCPPAILSAVEWAQRNPLIIALFVGFLLIVFFLRGISAIFFERSGDSLIWIRKMFGTPGQRRTLLDIVETWLRRQPEKVGDAHDLLYRKPAHRLLPAKLATHLLKHEGLNIGPPAMIVRHFAERKYWWLYMASWFSAPADTDYGDNPKYFRKARGYRNAIRVNLLFDVLDAELRDDVPSGPRWRRDYRTGAINQYSALVDPEDIHLRYRSSAPHYRWPDDSRPSSEREMATFRVIMAIENPMRAPIHLISVQDIVDAFPLAVGQLYNGANDFEEAGIANRDAMVDHALQVLQTRDVPMYGKRDSQTLRTTAEGGLVPEPVMRNLNQGKTDADGEPAPADYVLRWDPNIIDWSAVVDPGGEIFRSLAILVRAIEIASGRATPIRLNRGDVLIIDNLRSLVGRHEWNNIHPWWKQVVNYPERWWLRGFYGFRKSRRSSDWIGS